MRASFKKLKLRESVTIVLASFGTGFIVFLAARHVVLLAGASGLVATTVAGFLGAVAHAAVGFQGLQVQRRMRWLEQLHQSEPEGSPYRTAPVRMAPVARNLRGAQAIQAVQTPPTRGIIEAPNTKRTYIFATGKHWYGCADKLPKEERKLIVASIDLEFEKHKVLMSERKPDDGHYLVETTIWRGPVYAHRGAGYWDIPGEPTLFDDEHCVIAYAPLALGEKRNLTGAPEAGGPP